MNADELVEWAELTELALIGMVGGSLAREPKKTRPDWQNTV